MTYLVNVLSWVGQGLCDREVLSLLEFCVEVLQALKAETTGLRVLSLGFRVRVLTRGSCCPEIIKGMHAHSQHFEKCSPS